MVTKLGYVKKKHLQYETRSLFNTRKAIVNNKIARARSLQVFVQYLIQIVSPTYPLSYDKLRKILFMDYCHQ